MGEFFIYQPPDGEVCWSCPWKKLGLVEGGAVVYETASESGGVLDLSLTGAWASRGRGSCLFNDLQTGRCAGLVIERRLD